MFATNYNSMEPPHFAKATQIEKIPYARYNSLSLRIKEKNEAKTDHKNGA